MTAVHATVVIPGALVPAELAAELARGARAPALAEALSRARVDPAERLASSAGEAPHWLWLWRAFSARAGLTAEPVTAPYAWQALNAGTAMYAQGEGPLWLAPPVHFAVERDHLRVQRLDVALAAPHAQALASEADAVLREAGARLLLLDATHWFVRFDVAWRLTTRSLDAAVGRAVLEAWVGGADAARWRRVHNEIQMRWHAHPANAAREAAGQLPANALWLHGGGAWQALPPAPFQLLLTDTAVLRGWMLAAGVAPAALRTASASGAQAPARAAGGGQPHALALWTDLQDAASVGDWPAWHAGLARIDRALERLRRGSPAADRIDLILTGREHVRRVRLRPSDRWWIWRRHPLGALLAEPATA